MHLQNKRVNLTLLFKIITEVTHACWSDLRSWQTALAALVGSGLGVILDRWFLVEMPLRSRSFLCLYMWLQSSPFIHLPCVFPSKNLSESDVVTVHNTADPPGNGAHSLSHLGHFNKLPSVEILGGDASMDTRQLGSGKQHTPEGAAAPQLVSGIIWGSCHSPKLLGLPGKVARDNIGKRKCSQASLYHQFWRSLSPYKILQQETTASPCWALASGWIEFHLLEREWPLSAWIPSPLKWK